MHPSIPDEFLSSLDLQRIPSQPSWNERYASVLGTVLQNDRALTKKDWNITKKIDLSIKEEEMEHAYTSGLVYNHTYCTRQSNNSQDAIDLTFD